MNKNDPKQFSENDLDKLLNRSFLESNLSQSQNEKIMEAMAAENLGENSNYSGKPFLKTLLNKISLQVLIIGVVILSMGVYAAVHMNETRNEPKNTDIPQQERDHRPDLRTNNTIEPAPLSEIVKNRTPDSKRKFENQYSTETNAKTWNSYRDSTTYELYTAAKPDSIYVSDPAIILPKGKDSLLLKTSSKEKGTIKNNKQIKKKSKQEWREHEVK